MVDPFWKQPPNEHEQQLATAISSDRVCVPAKQMSTAEERRAAIMSSHNLIAELASPSSTDTAFVLAELGRLIETLSNKKHGEHSKQRKKTIDTEFKDVPAMEHISNPPVQQKQSQARKQPGAIGAPTTSSYKAAGARSSRERKQTMKAKELKALGRN